MDIVIFCIAGCISRNAVMIVLSDLQEIIVHMLYDTTGTNSYCWIQSGHAYFKYRLG